MVGSGVESVPQLFPRNIQQDEYDARRVRPQYVAISPFESGTGQHDRSFGGGEFGDAVGDRGQPRCTIGVGEWFAGGHFRPVGGAVKRIPVLESPTEPVRQGDTDGSFAAAGNTQQYDGGG